MKFVDRLKTSSKWQVGLGAILFVIGQPLWMKWGLDETQFTHMFAAMMAILLGQGMADFGKEKD